MQLFSCCLPCNVFNGCWVNVMLMPYSLFYGPPGLLVAPPRASCLSHEARRWSWICTTRMIWPRKMRAWAGERWKIWWHSCNSLPQGGHHEQLISLYTWSVFMVINCELHLQIYYCKSFHTFWENWQVPFWTSCKIMVMLCQCKTNSDLSLMIMQRHQNM